MSQKSPKPRVSDEIDKNLRRVYRQVLEEELPDRFTSLLDQLKKGEKSGGSEKDNAG